MFQTFVFNAEDSPLVDVGSIEQWEKEYGKDSDEYRVRVRGEFPNQDVIDEKGYVRMFKMDDIKYYNSFIY